jgi:tripartite-type tricarboxylate transporter receptor subunit TctC
MNKLYRQGLRLIGAGMLAALAAGTSSAAGFPDHAIQLVSPYAAGGTNDYLTRLMARYMGEALKATIVVENRTGANGIVGASFVAKSAPDGYTLLMGNSATHGTNPTLYPDAPYDAVNDFAPVGMVGSVPIVLAVNAALGVNNVKELLAYGKAHPGKLSFGSSGVGGTGHLAGESFKAASHLDLVHVPYKGDAPAVTDTMGGQVSMSFVGISSATPFVATGKLKIIAIANKTRVASLPDVPTFDQAGLGDIEFAQWYALFTRAGTPPDRLATLNQALKQVLGREDVQKGMATQGAEPTYTAPQELAAFSKSEVERFGKIIKDLKIEVK